MYQGFGIRRIKLLEFFSLTGQPQGIAPTSLFVGAIPCGCPVRRLIIKRNQLFKNLCIKKCAEAWERECVTSVIKKTFEPFF